jgi:hypothetical protein
MKRYIKDGKIKHRNQIVIRKDGRQYINPTEEMILTDGWEEYVTPVYEPTIEDYRKRKKDEILAFDSSEEVNQFCMREHGIWLDKARRTWLMMRLQAEQSKGKETTTLWYEGLMFELPVSTAIQMLLAIELYASECYDNTQRHLAMVDTLETKEEIESYDYRVGYPDLLEFE